MYTVEETKKLIKSLASSQGSYGRMYESLENNDQWEEFTDIINENGCKTAVDVVMLIAC